MVPLVQCLQHASNSTLYSCTQVSERKAGDPVCRCNLQCDANVSPDQRKALLDGFWKTLNFDVQNAYLCGCVQVSEVTRRYTGKGSESRRRYSRQYYVKAGSVSVRVCKEAFLNIFGISNGSLDCAPKAEATAGGSSHTDQRGRHPPVK